LRMEVHTRSIEAKDLIWQLGRTVPLLHSETKRNLTQRFDTSVKEIALHTANLLAGQEKKRAAELESLQQTLKKTIDDLESERLQNGKLHAQLLFRRNSILPSAPPINPETLPPYSPYMSSYSSVPSISSQSQSQTQTSQTGNYTPKKFSEFSTTPYFGSYVSSSLPVLNTTQSPIQQNPSFHYQTPEKSHSLTSQSYSSLNPINTSPQPYTTPNNNSMNNNNNNNTTSSSPLHSHLASYTNLTPQSSNTNHNNNNSNTYLSTDDLVQIHSIMNKINYTPQTHWKHQ